MTRNERAVIEYKLAAGLRWCGPKTLVKMRQLCLQHDVFYDYSRKWNLYFNDGTSKSFDLATDLVEYLETVFGKLINVPEGIPTKGTPNV